MSEQAARWQRGASDAEALYAYDPLVETVPRIKPYSVLRTTTDEWLNRRAAWAQLGIRGEVSGRDEALLFGNQKQLLSYDVVCDTCGNKPPLPPKAEAQDTALFSVAPVLDTNPAAGTPCARDCAGQYITKPRGQFSALEGGTSLFDPVLCELMYRWYCPADGLVLDPFAGGAVRGVAAWKLGRDYVGIELRKVQVADNRRQMIENGWHRTRLGAAGGLVHPVWLHGDSDELLAAPPPYAANTVQGMGPYDFLFTCPPYADLEVYSDDPNDLSYIAKQQGHEAFVEKYQRILHNAARLLAPDRFAVVVIGEARGQEGAEYGLVQDTQAALAGAGLVQHASIILVNPLGTLPLRAGKQWEASRVPGRHHQYVLVYRKGDRKRSVAALQPLKLFTDEEPTTAAEEAAASDGNGSTPPV